MKVTIAIDSFKGSMTSMEAGTAIAEGIRRVYPDAAAVVRPLADGGEGTVDALVSGMNGEVQTVTVTGPFGSPVKAKYGLIRESGTAVMEMSQAAGITLAPREELNPLDATTYGVGEMIRDAIGKGCRRFIMGIGGSATNDGGAGMLQALGFGLMTEDARPIAFGAKGLAELAGIETGDVLPELSECSFQIACDVTNPLCGEKGCSAIYGPQKGATPSMILQMDSWLQHFAELSAKVNPEADAAYPGTGAAGGLGFAFLTFMNARLESGISIILRETRLEEYVKDADYVITGEGRLDAQTSMGKAPDGVAQLAKKYGRPVLAFAGCVTKDARECNLHGIDAFFPILRGVVTLEEAMETANAASNLTDTVEQVFRLIRTARG